MSKRSIRRSLTLSALTIVLCLAMLIGTTFAWFTDSVTSGSNIIKAGNLDIVLEYWDGDSWVDGEGKIIPFVAADGRAQDQILWEPGCTYQMAPFRVRNVGNLSAKILITIDGVTGDAKLLEVIQWKTGIKNIPASVLNGSAGNQLQRFEGSEQNILYGTPDGNIVFDWSLAGKGETTPGTGHTDTSPEFTISGHMAEEAGNEYQGLSIEGISLTIIATQQTYESDSFDKYYDKNATYPSVDTVLKDDSTAITLDAKDVSITVPADASAGNYTVDVSNPQTATIDDVTTVSYDISLLKDGVKVANDGTEYEVKIKVGAGLNITNVLHNGEAITDYSYDPRSEYVIFTTSSFSPFAVEYTTYAEDAVFVATAAELQAVITDLNAAYNKETGYTASATIVLLDDITFKAGDGFMYTEKLNGCHLYLYHANVTLDLNGHDITAKADALWNGKKEATALFLVRYSELNIIGEGNIVTENKAIGVYAWANCTVNIYGGNYVTNSVLRKESAVYVNNTSAKINVYGGTYTDSDFGFNTHNTSCTDKVITLHEGISFYDYQDHFKADYNGGRIVLAEGCTFISEEIDGKILYTIVAE